MQFERPKRSSMSGARWSRSCDVCRPPWPRPTRPDTWAATSSVRDSTWISSCTPEQARTSVVRRQPSSIRWRDDAVSLDCGRHSPPSPASTPARPSSTTSSPSRVCRRSSWAARSGSGRWEARSRRGSRCTRSLVMSPLLASTRRRSASRCENFSTTRAAFAPGTPSSSGLPADPRLRSSPTNISMSHSTTRASARRDRCSAPKHCRYSTTQPASCVRCCGGPSSMPTNLAVNARRAAKARTGWCRSCVGSKAEQVLKLISPNFSTSRTPSSENPSARWATERPARSCPP